MKLSNSLTVAAEDIRTLVADADVAIHLSVCKSIEAGQRLAIAKSECAHGKWLPFLEVAGVAERKAQRLMKLAASGLKSDTVTDLGGVTGALRFLTKSEAMEEVYRLAIKVDLYGPATGDTHRIRELENLVQLAGVAAGKCREIILEFGEPA